MTRFFENSNREIQPEHPRTASAVPSLTETFIVLMITVAFIIPMTFLFFVLGRIFNLDQSTFLLVEALIIVPALIFGKVRGFSLRRIFRMNSIDVRQFMVTIVIGISLILVINALENWIQNLLQTFPHSEWFQDMKANFELGMLHSLRINSVYRLLSNVLAVVLFAAVGEEMLFRGFIQQTFENRMPKGWSVFLTAFIFTILHPFSLIPIMALAVILGVMSLRSNSIFPTIIIHGMNNGISLAALNVRDSIQSGLTEAIPVSPVLFLFTLLIFIVSFKYYLRITRGYEQVREE